MIMHKEHIFSLSELDEFSRLLSKKIETGERILLFGERGSGKTTLVRKIMNVYGGGDQVSSPSFSIQNDYKIDAFWVSHFDFDRLENEAELSAIGFWETWEDRDRVIFVEWPERIAGLSGSLEIHIQCFQGRESSEERFILVNVG